MLSDAHTYSNEQGTWKVADLWAAAEGIKPVRMRLEEVVDVEELLDSHTWSAGAMTVREILDHANRVRNADLSYPIILTPEGWIGDGCHRLVRAWQEGLESVLVVQLKEMPAV